MESSADLKKKLSTDEHSKKGSDNSDRSLSDMVKEFY